MKEYIHDNFLLENEYAIKLYHDFAADLAIIDYHTYISPKDIAEDRKFENLTQLWLENDPIKWRAMRAHGIEENFITGNANDWQKFEKWAETVPFTIRNPLFHWTHLELKRHFGISKLLTPDTAKEIYDACSEQLKSPEFSARNLLVKMKVKMIYTINDMTDDLVFHKKIKDDKFEVKVLPTFGADKILMAHLPFTLKQYVDKLEEIAKRKINSVSDLLLVLRNRLEHFAEMGCQLSDHDLRFVPATGFDFNQVNLLFSDWRKSGKKLNVKTQEQFNALMMNQLAKWYKEKEWTQQFHLGALRNTSSRLKKRAGDNSGSDSVGDYEQAESLSSFMNRLDKRNDLPKTILHNANPRDNAAFATMTGNFQDGSVAGKIQWGSAWWLLGQKNGVEKHLNMLSDTGLLSHFIGVASESGSLLSFSRHEYFRRILCNVIGQDVEKGLLPDDMKLLGKLVQNVSCFNAEKYF